MAKIVEILGCALVLLMAESNLITADPVSSFNIHQVVPDVISTAPPALATVRFPSGVEVQEGNELTPTQVKDIPTVTWEAEGDQFYTLIMTDPDAPSRKEPTRKEFQHWLVGNIQGGDISTGETLTPFRGSGPPQGTDLHRYVFLVYKQPGRLSFDEPRLDTSRDNRAKFSTANFTQKYNLGDPIAGNFYQAKFEE